MESRCNEAETFGRWVRCVRRERNLTQATLADLMGYSQAAISSIETDGVEDPAPFAIAFAQALDIDVAFALNKAGVSKLPDDEMDILMIREMWKRLNADMKDDVLSYAEMLLAKQRRQEKRSKRDQR